jgi:hypothetical protein
MRDLITRNLVPSLALGVATLTGGSLAHAQTADTIIAAPPGSVVVAQQPIETVETVRTVSTTTPRHVARHPVRAAKTADRVTTTRTVAQQDIVAAPPVVGVAPPIVGPRYYDAIPPAPVAAPPYYDAAIAPGPPVPAYRYVYEPDRILVIDPYTNIAVRALPR